MLTDQTISLHGSRFHYTEQGDRSAPPVVMLHGVTGHARTWDDEGAALASRYRVIALDQRGHGDSDPPPDADYTIATLAGDLAAFADALSLQRFAIVGLSLGGRVAIQYAGPHPDRVTRLVVVDIGPDIAPDGRLRVGTMMAGTPERFNTIDDVLAYQRANNPRYTDALLRARERPDRSLAGVARARLPDAARARCCVRHPHRGHRNEDDRGAAERETGRCPGRGPHRARRSAGRVHPAPARAPRRLVTWGAPGAPQAPRRSERPGEPVALL
jgi:pimeloyl-ACP methyl ester carboxylesterase